MKDSRLAIKRRVFLSAVGLGISAPLALRMSRLAVAQPGARPKRLLIVFIPHGVPIEHYQPVWDGTTLSLTPAMAGSLVPVGVLAPLQPFANQVSVVQNISMNDGATNHAAVRAALTGFAEGKGSDSIDNIIAKAMGVKPWVLGALGYDSLFGFNENCYLSKQSTWVVPQVDPNKAANDMFGAATTSPTPAVDESVFRNQVLTLTESELDTLSASLAGLTREQNKLQVHLDAVRALKAGSSTMPVMSCMGRPPLPTVDGVKGKNVQDVTNFAQVMDAHLELIAGAFTCGAASVITLQSMYVNAQYKMDFTGGPGNSDLYHDPTSHSQQVVGRAGFAKVQRWFFERLVAKVIMPLSTTPDGADTSGSGHSVLDNTVIMTCSEIADGFFHNSQVVKQAIPTDANGGQKMFNLSLPYVIIGGGSGYLKQGGQIVGDARMHTDLLATLADAMGVPITTMGTQSVSPIASLKAGS